MTVGPCESISHSRPSGRNQCGGFHTNTPPLGYPPEGVSSLETHKKGQPTPFLPQRIIITSLTSIPDALAEYPWPWTPGASISDKVLSVNIPNRSFLFLTHIFSMRCFFQPRPDDLGNVRDQAQHSLISRKPLSIEMAAPHQPGSPAGNAELNAAAWLFAPRTLCLYLIFPKAGENNQKGREGRAIEYAAGVEHLYEDEWEWLSPMGRGPDWGQIPEAAPTWSPLTGRRCWLPRGIRAAFPAEASHIPFLSTPPCQGCWDVCPNVCYIISGSKALAHPWALT